jgi:hypothetical protein
MFMGERAIRQNITPTLMFVGDVCGKVEEAISRYTSVFRHSKAGRLLRYGKGEEQGGDDKARGLHARGPGVRRHGQRSCASLLWRLSAVLAVDLYAFR